MFDVSLQSMYSFRVAWLYILFLKDTTGDVIITIKSDADNTFQFRVTGDSVKKEEVLKKQDDTRGKTDTIESNRYNDRVTSPNGKQANTKLMKHYVSQFKPSVTFGQTKSNVRAVPKHPRKQPVNNVENTKHRKPRRKKNIRNQKRRRPDRVNRRKRKKTKKPQNVWNFWTPVRRIFRMKR